MTDRDREIEEMRWKLVTAIRRDIRIGYTDYEITMREVLSSGKDYEVLELELFNGIVSDAMSSDGTGCIVFHIVNDYETCATKYVSEAFRNVRDAVAYMSLIGYRPRGGVSSTGYPIFWEWFDHALLLQVGEGQDQEDYASLFRMARKQSW